MIKVDYKLLNTLLKYRTHSYDFVAQNALLEKIKTLLTVKIKHQQYRKNRFCFLVQDNKLPLMVAHLDINQMDTFREYFQKDIQLYRMKDNHDKCIASTPNNTKLGGGFDDKIGLLACIQFFNAGLANVLFTFDEEVGGTGVMVAANDIKKFVSKHTPFLIQLDRRGGNEMIVNSNGIKMADDIFENFLTDVGKPFGYDISEGGSFTDAPEITKTTEVCSVNVGCGYYDAHRQSEYILQSEVENCFALTYALLTNSQSLDHFRIPKEDQELGYGGRRYGRWYGSSEREIYTGNRTSWMEWGNELHKHNCIMCENTTYNKDKICTMCKYREENRKFQAKKCPNCSRYNFTTKEECIYCEKEKKDKHDKMYDDDDIFF